MKMPPEVPKFIYGTIIECKVSAYQIALKVEKATPDSFNKYQSDLKNAGWTIATASQSNGTMIIQATKGQNTIEVNLSNSDSGLNGSIVYKHTYPEWSRYRSGRSPLYG